MHLDVTNTINWSKIVKMSNILICMFMAQLSIGHSILVPSNTTSCKTVSTQNDCSQLTLEASAQTSLQQCIDIGPGSEIESYLNISFTSHDDNMGVSSLLISYCSEWEQRGIAEIQVTFKDGSSQKLSLNGWKIQRNQTINEVIFFESTITEYVLVTVIPLESTSQNLNSTYGLSGLAFYENSMLEDGESFNFNIAQSSFGAVCTSTFNISNTTNENCPSAIDGVIQPIGYYFTNVTNSNNSNSSQSPLMIELEQNIPIMVTSPQILTIELLKSYTIFSSDIYFYITKITDDSNNINNETIGSNNTMDYPEINETCEMDLQLALSFEDNTVYRWTTANLSCHDHEVLHQKSYNFTSPISTSLARLELLSYNLQTEASDMRYVIVLEEIKLWATAPTFTSAKNMTSNGTSNPEDPDITAFSSVDVGLYFGLVCGVLSMILIIAAVTIGCIRQHRKGKSLKADYKKQMASNGTIPVPKSSASSNTNLGYGNKGYVSYSELDIPNVMNKKGVEENYSTLNTVSSSKSSNSSENGHDLSQPSTTETSLFDSSREYSDEITLAEEGLKYTL